MPERFFRFATLAITLALAYSGAGLNAQPDAFPSIQGKLYKFEKVADGIYYATGGVGSNNVVIVNASDVVLVDDGSTPAAARALLEDIKLITNKPVSTVINTHFHYDHSDGNSIFDPSVQIIAHEYVRTAILTLDVLNREPFRTSQGTRLPALIASLRQQISAETDAARKNDLSNRLAAAQTLAAEMKDIKPTPPNVTYKSKMVLYRGGREIDLLFLGRGHTAGDTFVYLPHERIVCTGDMDEGDGPAYLGDGFFDEWIATLEALKKLDFDMVLPGHGRPFHGKHLIAAFQNYLKDITAQVADLRRQGVTPEEAAKRVDLTSHQIDFPNIRKPGAELRGVRRIYAWMDEMQSNAPAPTKSAGQYADLPGVRIWYTDSGGNGIPVIFIHAATGSSVVWEKQIPAFAAAGYRVIAYDRRGYGRSLSVATGPQPGTGADDLENLMQHLGIEHFHLVATAAGGFTAFDYALSFPNRLKSMVVANSIGGVVDEDYQQLMRRLRPAGFDSLPPEFRELGPSYRASDPEGTEKWIELERASRSSTAAPPPQATKNRITFSLLEKIKVPTLLLTGAADLYAPPPLLKLFAERIPDSQSIVVPEVGHSAYWENPDLFNRVVLQFIGGH